MDTPFLLTIALSVFNIFGLVFFLKGIQKAPVSIVVPVSAIKLFTILTAVFIVGEIWKANYLYAFIFSLFFSLYCFFYSHIFSLLS